MTVRVRLRDPEGARGNGIVLMRSIVVKKRRRGLEDGSAGRQAAAAAATRAKGRKCCGERLAGGGERRGGNGWKQMLRSRARARTRRAGLVRVTVPADATRVAAKTACELEKARSRGASFYRTAAGVFGAASCVR